jgi:hypothetical protein
MAENVVVTTLEIKGGDKVSTTMKDLKNEIAGYRDELVTLGKIEDKNEQQKERQEEVIQRLRKATKLLTDVTNAHKESLEKENEEVDLANDSYNALQRQLTKLKKEYKDMTSVERDSELGKETLQNISALDTKLKELDAGMGVFNRNVGNYGKTFEESMAEARQSSGFLAQGLGTLTGALGLMGVQNEGLAKTITGVTLALQVLQNEGFSKILIKIKEWIAAKFASTAATETETAATAAHATAMEADAAATTTATAATNGFKKALIATGIGAIIVAIGTLIAYWDELTAALGFSTEATEAEKQALEEVAQAAEEYRQAVGAAIAEPLSGYVKLRAQYKQLKSEHEKRKWIEQNTDAFKDLGLSVNDLNSAEEAFVNNTQAVVDAMIRRAMATAKEQQLTQLAAKYMEEKLKAEDEYAKKAVTAGSKVTTPMGGIYQEGELMTLNSRSGQWQYTEKGAAKQNEFVRKVAFGRANQVKGQMEALAEELATDFADIIMGKATGSSSGSSSGSSTSTISAKLAAELDEMEALIAEEATILEKELADELWVIDQKMKKEAEAAAEEKRLREESEKARKAELQSIIDASLAEMDLRDEQIAKEKEYTQAKIETAEASIDATTGLLDSVAGALESFGGESEKAQKAAKAAKIASTIIETISGATSAYMSAQTLPPPFGQIVGAANAAAVTATGMANIAKMRSLPVSGSSMSGALSAPSASVAPPNIPTELQTTRNLTSASEEELLNSLTQPQKVYILQSDIEAAGQAAKAIVEESSF